MPTGTDAVNDELLKQAAVYYAAEFGLAVFRLVPGTKIPFKDSHGYKDASTNIEQIEEWWTQTPDANIGIPCGKVSGLYVVDGKDGVTEIEGFPPPTVKTPKGCHWWFRWRPGLPTTLHIEDVDCVRSDGYYVVVPPSVRSDGEYEWIEPFSYAGLAEAPELPTESTATGGVDSEAIPYISNVHASLVTVGKAAAYLSAIPPAIQGDKGDMQTYKAAMIERDFGLSRDQSLILLRAWNRECKPPWSEAELIAKIENANKYGKKEPERKAVEAENTSGDGTCSAGDSERLINPVPITELPDAETVEWVLEPYLAKGFVTLLTSLPKVGKTTLLLHVASAMCNGGQFGEEVRPGKMLILSEEPANLWKSRAAETGLTSNVEIQCRPFIFRPDPLQWAKAITDIADLVGERGYQLVVIDTLGDISPCDDENDAAKMLQAVKPLHLITEAGAAVLILHHSNKSEGDEGRASRGSIALPGFCDINVEMRRFDRLRITDTRRKVKYLGRLGVGEHVFDLTPDGYVLLGSKIEVTKLGRMKIIDSILGPEGKSVEQILDEWPDGKAAISKSSLKRDLKSGVNSSEWDWATKGRGVKNDEFRYHRRQANNSIQPYKGMPD